MKNVNLIYLIDFTFWDVFHIILRKRCGICIVPHNIFSSIRCVMHAFLLARLSPRLSFFLPVWSWLSYRSSIFPFRLLSIVIKNILKPNRYWLKWPVCVPWWKPTTKFPGNVPQQQADVELARWTGKQQERITGIQAGGGCANQWNHPHTTEKWLWFNLTAIECGFKIKTGTGT